MITHFVAFAPVIIFAKLANISINLQILQAPRAIIVNHLFVSTVLIIINAKFAKQLECYLIQLEQLAIFVMIHFALIVQKRVFVKFAKLPLNCLQ